MTRCSIIKKLYQVGYYCDTSYPNRIIRVWNKSKGYACPDYYLDYMCFPSYAAAYKYFIKLT